MQDLIYKMRNLKLRKNPKEENRDMLAAGVRGEYNKKKRRRTAVRTGKNDRNNRRKIT